MYTEYDNEGNYTQDEKPDRRKLYIIIGIIIGILLLIWLFFFSGWIKFGYGSRVKSISISMKTLGLKPKDTYQLYAEVNPKNAKNKTVKWQSTDSNIVEVNEKTGMVTAIAVGKAIVTVVSNDNKKVSADCVVTVSDSLTDVTGINFTSEEITIYRGGGTLLEVNVTPETAKTPVLKFTSSNSNIVKVNDIGYVTGLAVGTATVMVQTEDGKFSDTITINVKAGSGPVIINPTGLRFGAESVSIVVNTTQNLAVTFIPSNATNTSLTWTTTDSSVVTVVNGAITGVKIGTAQVKATTFNNITATINVNVIAAPIPVTGLTVDPTAVTLKQGGTKQITPKITPDNASNKEVTYTSSDTKVATVSEAGLITAVTQGKATITVTTKDQNKTATVAVTVTEESTGGQTGGDDDGGNGGSGGGTGTKTWTISGPSQIVANEKGGSTPVTYTISGTPASGVYITCSSTETRYAVASTDNSKAICKLTGVSAGTTTLKVKINDNGKYYTASKSVKVVVGEEGSRLEKIDFILKTNGLKVGTSYTFSVAIYPANITLSKAIAWKSTNTAVATISASGNTAKVTAVKAGVTVISATAMDKFGNTKTVNYTLSVYSGADTVAPSCAVTSEAALGSWTNLFRTITVKCIDNVGGTGCLQDTYQSTFQSAGEYDYIPIKDKAGNTTSCKVRKNIDKTAPTCGTISGSSTAWTNKDRTIGVGCNDSQSGCSATSKTFTTTTKTSAITISDKAGNTASCSVNVYVDKTSPSCSISTTAGYATSKNITIKGSDSNSGVSSITYSNSSGTHTASVSELTMSSSTAGTKTGTVKDKAGNTKSCSLSLKSRTQYSIRSCNSCKSCEYAGVKSKTCIKYSSTPSQHTCSSTNSTKTLTDYKIVCAYDRPACGSASPYYCNRYKCSAYKTVYNTSCTKCGCASWSSWGSWTNTYYSSTATTGVQTRTVYYEG